MQHEIDMMAKQAASSLGGALARPSDYRLSFIENTDNEIKNLERQLENKKELKALLESEPKLNRLLELLGGNRY